jgi:CheY-like chemotaxis protein
MLREATANGRPFNVAQLDRRMPGMDGLDVARAVKADAGIGTAHLVMMTALGDRRDDESLRHAGVEMCIAKPIKATSVLDSLVAVLTPKAETAEAGRSAAVPQPGAATSADADPVRPRTRVLVAEDNIVNQTVARYQLQKLGCTVDTVGNGAEAVEALARFSYDVVLMDCQMPEMDGYEATATIRRREGSGARTPIIAMTANALLGDREKCLAAGMDDYVSKPVAPAELARVLRHWLTTVPTRSTGGRGKSEPDGAALGQYGAPALAAG